MNGRHSGTLPTLLAVPNVSVGDRSELIPAIESAFTAGGAVRELSVPHYDPDHGRTVFTLAGAPGLLSRGLLAGTAQALDTVDFSSHTGSHPCVGVVDVAPVVYLGDADRGAAWVEALVLADLLGHELAVPVFLYGELAAGRSRAELRRGGFPGLAARVADGEVSPDFGPAGMDVRAGAVLVTARPPLVAFNIELAPPAGLDDAVRIAAAIREGGERGLPGVRAIGIRLAGRGGVAQVSVNVEDYRSVRLADVVAAVAEEAAVGETELVGVAPAAAFEGFPDGLTCRNRATLEDALGF